MTTPGTYREADESPVGFEVALVEWEMAARPALEGIARRYHAVITYEDLAKHVQRGSGVRTRMLLPNWIGKVLGAVALDCHESRQPLLSALCVHSDGTIGEGYAKAVADTYGGPAPPDLELHAAEERLKCYQHYHAAGLPADGGTPALTEQMAAKRNRQTTVRSSRAEGLLAACPTCYLVLPLSGRCNNCGWRSPRASTA